ncbi:MAG TPA: alpha/beta hydrolase [Acidimicrobiales bacterium]|nr:alpha/beta hydrolase [Acidimicrobiales bacterium]
MAIVGAPRAIDRLEIEAGGLTFTGRACGPLDGRRVLLLHGFPQTSWAWRDQLWALGHAGFRAVAPDQRGYCHGARPSDPRAYRTECLIADIVALADSMEMHHFDLVGHDWGGLLAWLVASRHAARVRSLSVVSTPHPLALQHALLGGDHAQAAQGEATMSFQVPDEPERLLLGPARDGSGLRRLLEETGLHDEAVATYVGALLEPGALTAALNWYRSMDGDALSDLEPVGVPTLYVWSSDDAAFGRAAAEGTRACVAGPYAFEVLEGVSHWVPETAPERLSALLFRHLAST